MLININRDELLRPLQAVAGVVERRHTLPILSNVLIQASETAITFTATDLEIQISVSMANNTPLKTFAITTSARKLLDICRALPEGGQLTLDLTAARLKIKAGGSQFNLQTLPAEDFPKLKSATETPALISVPQKDFKKLIHRVHYAMAQQDIRYYLNGLLLLIEPESIKMVTTDGHRLALCALELRSQQGQQEVILPRKTITELVKLLEDEPSPLNIEIRPTQARFMFANTTFESKVIDGKFPDYQKVVPQGYTKTIKINRLTLLRALQRAAILSNDKFKGVRLMITENNLSVVCSNNEHEEAQEDLSVDYAGEPLDIGFNVNYLMDVLNNLSSDEIDFAFGDANSSCLVTTPEEINFKYVVMPLRI